MKTRNYSRLTRFALTFLLFSFIALSAQIAVSFYVTESYTIYQTNCSSLSNVSGIFCLIITKPDNLKTKARAVHESWASECDMVRFVTVIPESYDNTSNMPVYQPTAWLQEDYKRLTDKIFLSLVEMHRSALTAKFNWFLKADDDTFVFMDHLKEFLKDKNPCDRISYGSNVRFELGMKRWQQGGAGYLLGRGSIIDIATQLDLNYNFCANTGREDVDMASCLKKIGTVFGNSLDSQGRERFHQFSFETHYSGKVPPWMYKKLEHRPEKGKRCCSDKTISFHYMDESSIRKMYRIWSGFRSNKTGESKDFVEQVLIKSISKDLNSGSSYLIE